MSNATVVLVHGAMHGSWCWERVVEGLWEQRIPSIAVDLPGRGAHRDRAVGISESVAVIREAIGDAGTPVVLCGHSAAGVPITVVGSEDDRVCRLVYLAAFMPGPEEDMATLTDGAWARVLPHLVVDADGMGIASEASAAELFYHDCSAEDVRWAFQRLVRERLPSAEEAARAGQATGLAPWTRIATTYVICRDDRALPPQVQREMAAKAQTVLEWPTSHSPFLSRPDLLVTLLAEYASSVGDQ